MPPKSKKEPVPKELYLFLVEADELKGASTASTHIVSKLVSDKVFSESEDVICIKRHDDFGSFNFVTATWDLLKDFKDTTTIPARKPAHLVNDLDTACEALMGVGVDDEYAAYKILYFGYFNSFRLDENDIVNIKTRMETDDILLTLIFPVEESEMSPIQLENFVLAQKIFKTTGWCHVYSYKQALAKVLNLKALKDKRSMPWNVNFEIGASLSMNVKKLIINRKHAPEFKNPSDEAIIKETIYTLNDGTVIDEESLGDAYLYGDEVVCPEKDSGSGEGGASLKLLAFCPRENVQPTYMTGEGSDIFFAREDTESALKFNALVRAMANLNTVAIVRKVYRKNAQVQVGVLAPDLQRKGLIYTDLCYADDISTPAFAPLIKEDGGDGITEKDELIDELIRNKTLPKFDPFKGPVDPKLLVQREAITRKILNEYIAPTKKEGEDGENGHVEDKKVTGLKGVHNNIELYFQELIKTDADINERIKSIFPLVVNKVTGDDRPSGKQIFRKRGINDETNGNDDKRIKLEGEVENVEVGEAIPQAATCDMDDLLDDL